MAHLHAAGAGGICTFVGTTRADMDGGRRIVTLDYESHSTMVRRQLADLTERARARWPIERIVLSHRTGRVAVGEASVVVGVSCPHRVEAFEACRWLIDTLKAELAVWKKDVYDDGSEAWTPPNKEAFRDVPGRDDTEEPSPDAEAEAEASASASGSTGQ